MNLTIAVLLFLLNARSSYQGVGDFIKSVIKNTTGCKNVKNCDIPKIKALALDSFPPNLRKEVEIPVKIVVVMEQQTKKTDKKVGDALMNAIMIALDTCSQSQKAFTSTYRRVVTAVSNSIKMIKGVEEVILSGDKKNACVVMSTLKKFSREHCRICQTMIPDFLDRRTAEKMTRSFMKTLTSEAPTYIKDYLIVIKMFAGSAAAYMDKLVVCVKSGKDVDSCRNATQEETLCRRMETLFNLGSQLISFMSSIGTTIATEVQGFVGRVATTHKAYKQCLLSGAPVSINISRSPVETNILDKYEAKVKDELKPLTDVVSRALQTKLRMLRERRLQRARGLRVQRYRRRR